MKNGYTVTELMMCIVIIIILSILIFSAVVRAKRPAKDTICLSNLRQVHAAIMMYESDNGSYPRNWLRSKELLSYTGNVILRCQSAPNVKPEWRTDYKLYVNFEFKGMEDLKECQLNRGEQFPAVIDHNHSLTQVGYEQGELYFLIVRFNGSAVRVPYSVKEAFARKPEAFPCPKVSAFVNL